MIYFASSDRIKKITGTADALSDEKIRSCQYMVQVSHILPILGFELYEYIGTLITVNALGEYETELVESYLQPVISWHTLALGVTQSNTQTEIGTGHQSDIAPVANPYRIKNHYAGIGNAYIKRCNKWLERVQFPYYDKKQFNHAGDYFGINLEPVNGITKDYSYQNRVK